MLICNNCVLCFIGMAIVNNADILKGSRMNSVLDLFFDEIALYNDPLCV